jgi:hypothetical protein
VHVAQVAGYREAEQLLIGVAIAEGLTRRVGTFRLHRLLEQIPQKVSRKGFS